MCRITDVEKIFERKRAALAVIEQHGDRGGDGIQLCRVAVLRILPVGQRRKRHGINTAGKLGRVRGANIKTAYSNFTSTEPEIKTE